MKKTSKINKEQYLELYNAGKSDMEISTIMKAPYRTISNFRKQILKLPLVQDNVKITKEQEEILLGTLLGDSTISFTHAQCRFPKLSFVHSEKQETYFKIKFEKLNVLLSSYLKREYKTTTVIKNRVCNVRPVLYAIGKNLKVLQEYRNTFYPNGIKIIPIKFLENTFTEISLAYLFMDDGNKNGKTINLNLQNFELENLIEFQSFLLRRFNLEFTIKKDKTLYLKQNSYIHFKSLVLPYITIDSLYKLS